MTINFNVSQAPQRREPKTGGQLLVSPTVRPRDAEILRAMRAVTSRPTIREPGTGSRRGRMYEASVTNRMTSDFGVSIASGNAQVLNSYIAAAARARTLERDNPYAWRGLQLFINNVCGSEPFKLQVRLGKKDSTGKFVKEKDTIDKVVSWWKKEGRPENYTVQGDMTRSLCYWQAIAALVRDGGILWRKHHSTAAASKFAVEPIEIDRLDHWLCRPAFGTANEIQFGIERDRTRRRVAYHILTRHPGDVFAFSYQPAYRQRVLAEDVIHFQDIITRAGQDKAMPRFCSVITGLHRLDQYDIAEMSAAISAACYAGFLVRKAQQGTEFQGDVQTEDGQKEIHVEPGTLYELDSMQDFKQWSPQHPVEAYGDFTNQNIRRSAVGLGLSHFSLSENYEGISYASGRMSLLEGRREYKKLQEHMIANLVVPEFEARLAAAMASGALDISPTRYQELCDACGFIPTRWEWVDPLKDGQANILNIDSGLDSRQRVIAESERGGDAEAVDAEQAEDNDSAKAHDLAYGGGLPTIPKQPEVGPSGGPGSDIGAAQPPAKNGGKQPPRIQQKKRRGMRLARLLLLAKDDDEVDEVLLREAGLKNGRGRALDLLAKVQEYERMRNNDEPHEGEQ